MRFLLRSSALFLLLGACNESAPAVVPSVAPAEPAAPAQPVAQAEPDKPAAPAEPTDSVVDPSFELKLVSAGPYKSGELGSFQVSLKPRGEYHINQDYPMKVSVNVGEAAVSLPKKQLQKADAAEYGENVARFDVPFTAEKPGEHKVQCEVDFAVCTPETCVPDTRTLALALPVE
jgi:hypothetical protein